MASLSIKTDDELLQKLKNSASKKLSAEEMREQRISFIYSGLSKNKNITKVKIGKVLDESKF